MTRPCPPRLVRTLLQPAPRARIATAALAASPALPATAQDAGSDFIDPIRQAHGESAYDAHADARVNMDVNFYGNDVFDGDFIFDTPVGRARMEDARGFVVVFDGQEAYLSPPDSDFQGARFHSLTWPYFLAMPFKLDDPGAHVTPLGKLPLDGRLLDAAKLTFGDGVGDAPDDWYILFRDDDGRLVAAAYIVTYGKSVEEASKSVKAVVYDDFKDFDGVLLPTSWTFHPWNETDGIDPTQTAGEVTVRSVEFFDAPEGAYAAPAGAKVDPHPAGP